MRGGFAILWMAFGATLTLLLSAHLNISYVSHSCNAPERVIHVEGGEQRQGCEQTVAALAQCNTAREQSKQHLSRASQAQKNVVTQLLAAQQLAEETTNKVRALLHRVKTQVAPATWYRMLQARANASVVLGEGESDASAFEGTWEDASSDEWDSLLRYRGCGQGEPPRVQCCHPVQFPNFTTPLRHQRFFSTHPFRVVSLQRLLAGGVLSFVGDSISSQIYESLRLRTMHAGLLSRPCPLRMGAAACTSLIDETAAGPDFTLELFRLDKSKDPDLLITQALALPEQLPAGPGPRHIVVANTGLHFSDSFANETLLFREQIQTLAAALRKFNDQRADNFGFLRDITPQHFQARTSSSELRGDYQRRNRTVTHCAPWGAGLLSTRHSSHNEILTSAAKEHGLAVQRTDHFLRDRFDAHLETRDGFKRHVLDCTHWCAPVFDVFDDTMLYTIASHLRVPNATTTPAPSMIPSA